jgi:hypothetical protein
MIKNKKAAEFSNLTNFKVIFLSIDAQPETVKGFVVSLDFVLFD